MSGQIGTVTGRQLDPFDPDPDAIVVADIVHGLVHSCRFAGQCDHFYSVAHHSLHVASEVDRTTAGHPRLRLFALLHDAAEAYIGDLPRPVKRRIPAFQELEAELLAAVWESVGVAPPTDEEWETVMAADDRLLAHEAAELLAWDDWAPEPTCPAYELAADGDVRERFESEVAAALTAVESRD
jgi:hypothetical protein